MATPKDPEYRIADRLRNLLISRMQNRNLAKRGERLAGSLSRPGLSYRTFPDYGEDGGWGGFWDPTGKNVSVNESQITGSGVRGTDYILKHELAHSADLPSQGYVRKSEGGRLSGDPFLTALRDTLRDLNVEGRKDEAQAIGRYLGKYEDAVKNRHYSGDTGERSREWFADLSSILSYPEWETGGGNPIADRYPKLKPFVEKAVNVPASMKSAWNTDRVVQESKRSYLPGGPGLSGVPADIRKPEKRSWTMGILNRLIRNL